MSPTQRTLKLLKEKGIKAAVVERWLRYAGSFGKRQDMFGIIDVLAITSNITLGIQCCSGSAAEHYRKITEDKNQETYDWLSGQICVKEGIGFQTSCIFCPSRSLEIWAWRKLLKKRGGKAKIWQPKIIKITLEDLEI